MPQIRQLSQSVINKIAAGEVIERPASVAKELLENAVDAGATSIDVAVAKGGAEMIRIADNGCGIAREQLPLAIASHATSKLEDADDLFRVGTLGFRGEALAAIAEVSQTRIRTRVGDDGEGSELKVNGGEASTIGPCGCSPGTVIEVRNLFFNTPVRRRFLRTTQTEMAHVCEAVTRVALAWPGIRFSLTHNDRAVYTLPAVEDWRSRIASLFDAELAGALIETESQDEMIRLAGYVADPSQSRANNRLQYLFLNGRYIRDRSLQHALTEAYRGLLLTGRYPIAFLRLELPADFVDVNVHPTKLEVRFQDAGRIYSQLLGTLRNRFLSTDLSAKWRMKERPASTESETGGKGDGQVFADWAKQKLADLRARPAVEGEMAVRLPSETPTSVPTELSRRIPLELNRVSPAAALNPTPAADEDEHGGFELGSEVAASAGAPRPSYSDTEASDVIAAASPPAAMQVLDRYLVTEGEDGVVVIDQHALHERIIYEQLKQRLQDGSLEMQRLLAPAPVELTPTERATVLDAKEILEKVGLCIESFGGDTIAVQGYPAVLRDTPPEEILREAVTQLESSPGETSRPQMIDELLHSMACKSAIKAGDKLAPGEITALLEERHLAANSHHCPHGRPTALVFTRAELDRQFKRT